MCTLASEIARGRHRLHTAHLDIILHKLVLLVLGSLALAVNVHVLALLQSLVEYTVGVSPNADAHLARDRVGRDRVAEHVLVRVCARILRSLIRDASPNTVR
jgi:hypothetical protein